MGLQPKINGKTVERAYEEYRNGVYLVNERANPPAMLGRIV